MPSVESYQNRKVADVTVQIMEGRISVSHKKFKNARSYFFNDIGKD
ncbi:MAG: hypothetical protein ACJA01_000528 [Saprospiraceae bacterium]|jgi:hypothetical protein